MVPGKVTYIILVAGAFLIFYWAFRKMRRKQNKTFSHNANVAAFLWMIRSCEGTANANGYRTLFGYEYFNDFSKHPNRAVTKGGYTSTAAGAYQILYKTWLFVNTRVELPDFSPESQDIAAVELIRYRGALGDVMTGDIRSAIQKCNKEWASLPGSPYGQPVRTLEQAIGYYTAAGGHILV